MYTKKSNVNNPLFTTENEFHTLLTIHSDIKKATFKLFPYIKEQIIETLFEILSSQALLYDQIIRKSVLLQGSVTKQTQIKKLVEEKRFSFEKKIQEHLNSFNTTYECPLSETKVTISKGKLSNNSKDDSLCLEQESIISKMKKKMKIEKPQHGRTKSGGTTFQKIQQEEKKQREKDKKKEQDKDKQLKEKLKLEKEKMMKKKPVLYQKERKVPKYKKITLRLDKQYYRSMTQNDLYPNQQTAHSALLSLTQLKCMTERKNSEKDLFEERKQNPLTSYQSFPQTIEYKYRRIGSNPTRYTKNLWGKYREVVDSYEKFETEEDDSLKYSIFQSKKASKSDLKKKNSDCECSMKSFIISDRGQSESKSKTKIRNRNVSCGNKPKKVAWK